MCGLLNVGTHEPCVHPRKLRGIPPLAHALRARPVRPPPFGIPHMVPALPAPHGSRTARGQQEHIDILEKSPDPKKFCPIKHHASGREAIKKACDNPGLRPGCHTAVFASELAKSSGVLHLVNNSLESSGIIDGEVSKNLAVDLNTGLVDKTHELAVAQILQTGGGIDALNPQSAEIALFILAVAISISKTLFPCILGNGPHIAAATVVTAGKFQNFFTTCA